MTSHEDTAGAGNDWPIALVPGAAGERWTFTAAPSAMTPAGAAQGGVLMGALVEAIERTSGRPIIWATGRYVRHLAAGVVMDIDVTIEVEGHATTQVSAHGRVEGVEIVHVIAAAGRREFPTDGTWIDPRPDTAARTDVPLLSAVPGRSLMADTFELRLASGPDVIDGERGSGRTAIWLRIPGGPRLVSAADLSVVADFAVIACSEAIGRPTTGNSLDNTLRVVERVVADHVIAEFSFVASANGFGHLETRIWSADRSLLAIASTTLVLRVAGSDGQSHRTNRRIV
jgi:acyl-CoA thioesterase-2